MTHNPGQLRQVESGIFEVMHVRPRMVADGSVFARTNATDYRVELRSLGGMQKLELGNRFHNGWTISAEPYAPLECPAPIDYPAFRVKECSGAAVSIAGKRRVLQASHQPSGQALNEWQIEASTIRQLGAPYYHENPDGTIAARLRVAYQPEAAHRASLALSYLALVGSLGLCVALRGKKHA